MRISFLPLPALGLWQAEISQPVLWECASLAQEPVQLALVVLIAAIGGELSLGYLPGISWGVTRRTCCHVLPDGRPYVNLKGQNNKQDLRKS